MEERKLLKDDPVLKEMFDTLATAREEIRPSKFWEMQNKKNMEQLDSKGFENFKRTVSLNYFTWIMSLGNSQMRFLRKNLPVHTVAKCNIMALVGPRHKNISWESKDGVFEDLPWKVATTYNAFMFMLWEYAMKSVPQVLEQVDEPELGNPFDIRYRGRLITQDLANSALEYDSIMSADIDRSKIKTVMELSGGYGRTSFVFAKMMPDAKYILVDIPPALYLAQRYFSEVFPDKKIFKFRKFSNFAEVRDEFEKADFVFLMPSQMELLPDNIADLTFTISSLQEMTHPQIRYYFKEIERLTSTYFYLKQWKRWENTTDNIVVKEEDYPVPENWDQIYRRECRVQTEFFEALYRVHKEPNEKAENKPATTESGL
ncbi:MAG: putative sugar O-methyltransferase [Candidatus Micrarchaeota archaeon]